MDYANCKIYNDGSHYIAIPYVPNPHCRRSAPPEELISIQSPLTETEIVSFEEAAVDCGIVSVAGDAKPRNIIVLSDRCIDIDTGEIVDKNEIKAIYVPQKPKKTTKKEMFESIYAENPTLKKKALRQLLVEKMSPYFETLEMTKEYVETQLDRKHRNMICRRARMWRKVNLQDFNYFCTFTYDSQKHTEESFKKSLRNCFCHYANRRGWKYIGVWERSPKKQRLHFHGLFYIPQGTMPGELIKVSDYSPIKSAMQHTCQNTFFNERYGRTDFRPIDSRMLGDAVAYLTKYLEKTGEKIIYSKNLPQYFYSDIMDKDIVCDFGLEGKKKILADDFDCWDFGEYMGKVCPETIAKLRKCN